MLGEDGPLVERLRACGAAVEVQALDARVATVAPRSRDHGPALGPARVPRPAKDAIALARRLRELQPDLVHTNSLKAALYGGVAARAGRRPGGVAHPRPHRHRLPAGPGRAAGPQPGPVGARRP